MSAVPALAVGCIVLLASAGQTVTGFGFALLAAPLLAVVVGSHESVAAVTVISLPVTSLMAWRHRRVVDIGTASRLVAAGAAGAPAGVWLLSILGGRVLQGLVGVTVLVFTTSWHQEIRPHGNNRLFDVVIGASAGLPSTSNGPPLMLRVRARGPAGDSLEGHVGSGVLR